MIQFGGIAISTTLRVTVVAVGAALLTWIGLVVVATPAIAYTLLGCQYDSGSISPITYRFYSVSTSRETGFQEAETDWDLTSAPGYFNECSTCLDPEINVTDDYYAADIYAQMAYTCDGDDTYSGNEVNIQFNTRFNLNDDENQVIARHELGHAYGLDHVSSGCHAMKTPIEWTCSGSRPSSDDVNGVNFLY